MTISSITLLFVIISFVFFMMLMKARFFDPIAQIKRERDRKLQDDHNRAQAMIAERGDLEGSYEAGLQEARQKAQEIIQQARQHARDESAQVLDKAKNQAREHLEQQMEDLSRWQENTYQDLQQERSTIADFIVERVFTVLQKTPVG